MIASETVRSLCNPVVAHFSTFREFPLVARATRRPVRTSRIYLEQTPSSIEQRVDFLSASGFEVVSGKFKDIELP